MNLNSCLKRIKISQLEKPNLSFLSKLQKQENNSWQHVYSFTAHPRVLSDFEEMCTFHQTSPESHFTQEIICTIATKNGRVSLSDDFLTITDGSSKKKTKVVSDKDFKHKLRDHFGIQLNYK